MIDMKIVKQKADYTITTGSCTVGKDIAFAVLKELEKDTNTYGWNMDEKGFVTIKKIAYH